MSLRIRAALLTLSVAALGCSSPYKQDPGTPKDEFVANVKAAEAAKQARLEKEAQAAKKSGKKEKKK